MIIKKSYYSFKNKHFLSILLMFIGSIAISFNGLVIRNIDLAEDWVVIFYRAFSFSFSIFLYLIFKYRKNVFKKIVQIRINGFLGGFVLSISNICFILSMTSTTVANTVFTISLIPFLTALLSFFILKEKIKKITIFTMIVALVGVSIMFYGVFLIGALWGNILALFAAFCFSIFTIILKFNKNTDMMPCLLISGIMAMSLSSFQTMGSLHISINDFLLCFILGGFLSGFVNCCFVFAARYIMAGELTLFFFIEISLSPFWVWLFLNEYTTFNTLIGGMIILISILIRAIYLIFDTRKVN